MSAQATPYQIIMTNPDAATLTVTLPYYEAVGVETYDLTISDGSTLTFSPSNTKVLTGMSFPGDGSNSISFSVQRPGGTQNLLSGVYDLVIAGYSEHACEYELPFQIVIMTKPVLELDKSDIVFCFGDTPINLIGEITNEDQFNESNLQLQYAWERTGSGIGGTASKAKTNYPANGFTDALDITNTGTALASGIYTVTPYVVYTTDDGREITIDGVSDNVTITVAPELVLTLTPSVDPICSGGTDAITVATTATDGSSTYQWKVKDAADGTYAAVTAEAFAPAPTNTTNGQITASYTVKQTYTSGAASCTATGEVDLDVRPLPQATLVSATGIVCAATLDEVAITTSVTGITFSWTVADNADVTNEENSDGTTALVDGKLALTVSSGTGFELTGDKAAQLLYTITPYVETCLGTPMPYTLDINPAPVIQLNSVADDATAEICNGTTATVNIKTTTTTLAGQPVTYNITRGSLIDLTVTETLPSGETATTGGADWATAALTNTSGTKDYATAVYTVTPTIGSCPGTARTFTVTVVPLLDITVNQAAFELCSTDPIAAITIGSGNAEAVQNSGKFALNWSLPFDDDKLLVSVNNNPQTGPTATGSGSLSNVILTNVADPAETVSATLTATASYTTSGGASCTNATKTVALTVNPKPTFKLGEAPVTP